MRSMRRAIGQKAKVCPICGTLIPRKTLNPKPVLIAMSIAICLLLCGTSYFMLEMFQGNAAITRLEGKTKNYPATLPTTRRRLKKINLRQIIGKKNQANGKRILFIGKISIKALKQRRNLWMIILSLLAIAIGIITHLTAIALICRISMPIIQKMLERRGIGHALSANRIIL